MRAKLRIFIISLLIDIALVQTPVMAGSWTHWHGDPANRGLNDVETMPAIGPRSVVVGDVAPGSGPVIAADGTIYVGWRAGRVVALSPDLELKWQRDTQGEILTSPLIGADGSIYVVGVIAARDHRPGHKSVTFMSSLHKFTPGGALLWVAPLPDRAGVKGFSSAPLNMWNARGEEVIIFPIKYQNVAGGRYVNLLALSTSGQVFANHQISFIPAVTTGGADFHLNCDSVLVPCSTVKHRPGSTLPARISLPMPGVALYSARDSDPFVVATDGFSDIVGYNYSPQAGFRETFRRRVTEQPVLTLMTPMVLADGHSVVRAYLPLEKDHSAPAEVPSRAWMLFAGPNAASWPDYEFKGLGLTPALTADGRIVTAGTFYFRGDAVLNVFRNFEKIASASLKSETLGPVAVSANHIFVSATDRLITYDANSLAVVAEFPWTGGGFSPPAISGDGRVYAVAGSRLYGFGQKKPCADRRCGEVARRPPTAQGVVDTVR